MANILLIDPPWYALQNINSCKPSYALSSLAAVLQENKHNCVIYNGEFGMLDSQSRGEKIIIDIDLYRFNLSDKSPLWVKTWENIRRIINNFIPSIVGITIPTAKYSIATKIAKKIKEDFPNITVIAGGPHSTIEPADIIQDESIDAVVKGEGEFTFLELVNAVDNGGRIDDIRGVIAKSNSNVSSNFDRLHISDIDDIPFPAWDRIYNSDKHHPNHFGAIFTSRGCPYRCIFCASFKIWGRKVRYMSTERVVSELQHTSQKYGTNYFRFNDDTFLLDQNRAIEICEKIKKINLNIKWECDVRADACSYETLKIMKSAGCVKINIGIESGNADILKSIEKNITLEDIYKAFEAIKKAKLKVLAYFIIGFPDETIDQINDSVKLMCRLKPDYSCWSIATPYPGTKLYETAKRDGLLNLKLDRSYLFHHLPASYMSKKIDYDVFLRLIRKIESKKYMLEIRRALIFLLLDPPGFFKSAYKRWDH